MRTAILLCSVLSLAACTDDSTAPTIASLTYSPMTMTVGAQTTITGSFTFTDPDGDLHQLAAEITKPDQSKTMLPMTNVQNVGSMTEGTLGWQLIVIPPAAGTYQLSLWVTDHDGNASNHLEASATAN